jgi:hypothetical protein
VAGRVVVKSALRNFTRRSLPRRAKEGRVNFTGFYGDYEIICGQQRGEFTLTQGTPNYTVAVSSTPNAAGSPTAVEGLTTPATSGL